LETGYTCRGDFDVVCDLRWILEDPQDFFERRSQTEKAAKKRVSSKRKEARKAKQQERSTLTTRQMTQTVERADGVAEIAAHPANLSDV
jgi:hypothetical protein